MKIPEQLAKELGIQLWQAEATIKLIDEGATIPFIARYRKEVTGSLDDDVLRAFSERHQYLLNLEKRKEEVIASIAAQEKLTPELEAQIAAATALVEVEDLYRPYKPKRKTRASVAREKGLEPLAAMLILQQRSMKDPLVLAADFIDAEKGVETAEDALAGAMDIIAEEISDNAELRKSLRTFLLREAKLCSVAADKEKDSVYSMYYEYEEPVAKIQGHRVLAVNRGEREGFLKVKIVADDERCLGMILDRVVRGESPAREYIARAAADAWSRLLFPSLENELRSHLTEQAADSAIKVFSANLHQLLMQPPVKGRVVMGFDPGIRTGCKIAVVDDTGKLLDTAVVYPTQGPARIAESKRILAKLIEKYGVSIISIGNGTASRECEMFIAELIGEIPAKLSYMVVSEAGASVYSASKLAAEEFPGLDVSLRSAVSIARRIQDPLAELVKIEPKAIGVGQYQHDMPKNKLEGSLDGVVETCVNTVGVDLNTASVSLLSYVAGVNSAVAKNIVGYREENGSFRDRAELLKVPKLGKKAYEQCAGFLRVRGGKSVLDNTAVHPESYKAAKRLLKDCGFALEDVGTPMIGELPQRAKKSGLPQIADAAGVGVPTLTDIIAELIKPGRDPRDELPPPLLRTDVLSMSDLKPDMVLMGTVRNVIDFGVFVDIGVHQDGLVHVSQIADRFIKHPLDAVKLGDVVKVKVLSVDEKKKRISLSMKGIPQGV